MSLWSRLDGIRQLKSSRTHFFVIKKEKEKELYIINAVQADPFLPFSHLILQFHLAFPLSPRVKITRS